ncbi:MAG: hypothetical protein QUS09_00245 [Methanotrichaceae archaeon]|nr:hypothetical protein [Methanotrichaceae archaeon]
MLSILYLLCLVIQASSQGYLGTVTTGTGIESPITVGSGVTPQGASVGAAAAQANLTGTMSLNLIDGVTRQLNLDIFQSGDLLLGYGNMTMGTGSQRVTAAGSLTANGITLYIFTVDAPVVYRLEITGSGASLAGRYQAFMANGPAWSGTVTGVSDQILSYRPATTLGSRAGAGSMGTTIGQPAGTLGTAVGQSSGVLVQPIGSNNLTRNRSFFSSSNGQTQTITSDGTTTITSSGGTTTTTTSDGTTSITYG